MRKSRLVQLLAVILIILVSSLILFTNNTLNIGGSVQDVLSVSNVEDVEILENGNAKVALNIEVAGSDLVDSYRTMLAAPVDAAVGEEMLIPENRTENGMTLPVREDYLCSIKKEQKSSYGFATRILSSSMIPYGEGDLFLIAIEAYMTPQVSVEPQGADGLWEIDVGPKDEKSLTIAAGDVLTKIMFAQQMMSSLEGEQVFDHSKTLKITLPAGAELINKAELEGSRWNLNFGGGTFMQASLDIADDSTLILEERTLITEQNTTATSQELSEAFREYKIFSIRYFLQGHSEISGENVWLSNDGDWARFWDADWAFEISIPISGSWNGVGIDAELVVSSNFGFYGYMGFDFEWFSVDWFEAYIAASASVNIKFSGTIQAAVTKTWEKALFDRSVLTLVLVIDGVEIEAELNLALIASIDFKGEAELAFDVETGINLSFKAGIRYESGDWDPYGDAAARAYFDSDLDLTVSAEIEPSLHLRAAFLLYGQAGPYIELQPYLNGKVTYYTAYDDDFAEWETKVGFRINIGLTIKGKLLDILGIQYPYKKTVYDQVLWEKWGRKGVAPSDISVFVEPDSSNTGGGVTISGAITSQFRGNKKGTVIMEYKTPTANVWSRVGITSSDNDGEYSYWWIIPPTFDAESCLFRSRWAGNDVFADATSESTSIDIVSTLTATYWVLNGDGEADSGEYVWPDIGIIPEEANGFYPEGYASKFTPPITPYVLTKVKFYAKQTWECDYWENFTIEVWDNNLNDLYHGEYNDINEYFIPTYEDGALAPIGWSEEIDIPPTVVYDDFYVVISFLEQCPMTVKYDEKFDENLTSPNWVVNLETNTILEELYYDVLFPGEDGWEPHTWMGVIPMTVGGTSTSALWVESYNFGKYEYAGSETFIPTETLYIDDYAIVMPVTFKKQGAHPIYVYMYAPNGEELWNFPTNTPADWTGEDQFVIPLSMSLNAFKENIDEPFRIEVYFDGLESKNLAINQTFRVVGRPLDIAIISAPATAAFGDSAVFEIGTSMYIPPEVSESMIFRFALEDPRLNEEVTWHSMYVPLVYPQEYQKPWYSAAEKQYTFTYGGTHYFQVYWAGVGEYAAAESDIVEVEVTKAESFLETILSTDTITYGSPVKITSKLTPLEGDTYNNPVTFQYADSPDSSEWRYLEVGQFNLRSTEEPARLCNITWTPPDLGVYYIRSSWLGNDNVFGANSSSVQLNVIPSNYTEVEIVAGENAELDRAPEAAQTLSVRVKDLTTGEYLQAIGNVDFYLSDYSNDTVAIIGSDNDEDGNGVYQIQLSVTGDNWNNLGPQHWTAEFTGTPHYMPSNTTANLTIYYYGVAFWVNPTYQKMDPYGSAVYDLNFKWLYTGGSHDSFNITVPSMVMDVHYTLSETIVTAGSPGQTEQVTLNITIPWWIFDEFPELTKDGLVLEDFSFDVVATAIEDSNFALSAETTLGYEFTPSVPSSPTGGIAVAINPKTTYIWNTPPWQTSQVFVYVWNNQNFDDNITITLSTSGISPDYEAQRSWFGWESDQITCFIPSGGRVALSLNMTIDDDTLGSLPSTYVYKISATSMTTLTTATDSGIIRYNWE